MGIIAENSLWSKGKGEVLQEFRKSTETVLSSVAGRGFSCLPGFVSEVITDMEIGGKFKLMELNRQIMAEAIDREIRAISAKTDIALRQWTMAWSQQKAELMADLQKEYADKSWIRTLSAAELESAMIDQEIRGLVILFAKIALSLEAEQLNKQFTEINGETMPYEKALAYWKMQTTIAKEQELPLIETTINEQVEAFDREVNDVYPEVSARTQVEWQRADYINKEVLPAVAEKASLMETLADDMGKLIEPFRAKVAKSKELADTMIEQIANHMLLSEERVTLAREKVKRAQEEILLTEKDITLDRKKIQIELGRANLELQRAKAKLEVVEALRVQLGKITTAMIAESDAEINHLFTVGRNDVAVKSAKITNVDKERYAAAKLEWQSQIDALNDISNDDKASRINIAKSSAKAALSEKLVHAFADMA